MQIEQLAQTHLGLNSCEISLAQKLWTNVESYSVWILKRFDDWIWCSGRPIPCHTCTFDVGNMNIRNRQLNGICSRFDITGPISWGFMIPQCRLFIVYYHIWLTATWFVAIKRYRIELYASSWDLRSRWVLVGHPILHSAPGPYKRNQCLWYVMNLQIYFHMSLRKFYVVYWMGLVKDP